MRYYSLKHQSALVDFKTATINGQAPDKGLYFPEHIPQLPDAFFAEIDKVTNEEIAFQVIKPFVGDSIPEEVIYQIVAETINFSIPLVKVTENISTLEMFHGNTLAFKDVGARFMSRCLGYFVKDNTQKVTVLVATSGDTGGAVADGFFGVEGVDVVILYPSGKVSSVQEKQLTTLGNNIHALEVKGTFDDCQQLVKTAFADRELSSDLFLTSANSINVARWLPQQFFYFLAYKQWADKSMPPVISVPSGNFGNICSALLAMRSGLPVQHFIAACNVNDVVPRYMSSLKYNPQKAVPTISNAMDVGDPSNFVRILEMFTNASSPLSAVFSAISFTDEETKNTIKRVYNDYEYLLDPHGAIGFMGLEKFLNKHPGQKGLFAETAHPIKFYDVVEPLIGKAIEFPSSIQSIMHKVKKSTLINPTYNELVDYLKEL